ncbi:MAG: diguanylate cyclase [Kurthia sp.]|nr:diguanylate cyclase [Candidatus Kurthia equi]
MILGMIINFSIMFTFIVFSYFLLEHFREKNAYLDDLHPFIVGMIATFIALLLMKTSIPFDNGLIADSRNISILIAGLLGGPYALLLTSFLVGSFRVFFFDISCISIISGLNIILLGGILFFISKKIKMTFKNIQYFLVFQTIEISFVLAYLGASTQETIEAITVFITTNVIGFYITFFVLKLFRHQFERIRTIQQLADTDYITGLPNNRKFNQLINDALLKETYFSLLLIDIDKFKEINRRYGHSSGDEILYELANRLKKFVVDKNTIVARISGDEFHLLCHDAAPAEGIHYATEFSLAVQKEPFSLSNGEKVYLTVSVGISSYPDNGNTDLELMASVDSAIVAARLNKPIKVLHANLL